VKKTSIKALMVSIEEYPAVSDSSTVYEAILALEKAQEEFDKTRYRHRAILVYGKRKKIVGKISQFDLIKSLETKYDELGDIRSASLSGLSPEFIRSMMKGYSLWQDDLGTVCSRVTHKKVKDIMYRPAEGEKVEEDATLGEALHALIVGHHQSLLVTRKKEIVGVLRLTDIFKLVCEVMRVCRAGGPQDGAR